MKKIISIFLLFVVTFAFCSCGEVERSTGKISVVTTIFPYYDFARSVSKGTCDVDMLLKPGSDVHSFEPTPSDILKIRNADLFIYNGGESDEWVDSILESLGDTDKPVVMKMTDYVKPLTEMDADHHAEDEEDEHIWTSLDNAKTLVSKISDEVSKLDQKHKTVYNKNGLDYIEKISKVQSEIENTVNSSESKKIVVGDRFPLLYFATEFSLDWECAFPGCSTETEPSLDRLSKLTDTIEKDKIKTILKLEMSENKVADTLADETNTKVRTFYSAESVSKEEFANNVTYVDLMERNNNALKEALSNDTN
ncbi:MAG: metal ABC transporter substrate-binding protein [Ruminococcus sp.]|nr:metal ABC transporter substrate-binding protein [Ruminococcus sp.]MEE0005306.1 metal ABC transporter substrate-binding protein [Ruminococcus sp.]